MPDFDVTSSRRDTFDVVNVSGDVDVATAPQLRVMLLEQFTTGSKRVVVDLTDLNFMDSTGLGVLVLANKAARERDADLRVVVASQRIRKLFTITGLHKTLDLRDTIDAAVDKPAT